MSGAERTPEATPGVAAGRWRWPRIVWLCAAVSAIAAVTLLLLFGITLWTLAGLIFLIVCPAVAAGVLIVERIDDPRRRRQRR